MQRLSHTAASPEGYKKLLALSAFLAHSGLEANLLELISIRASEINGCAWCLDFHSKRLRHNGETEQRIYLLSGWRDAPVYSPRERAALEWTETLTLIAGRPVSDDLYQRVREHFSEADLATAPPPPDSSPANRNGPQAQDARQDIAYLVLGFLRQLRFRQTGNVALNRQLRNVP